MHIRTPGPAKADKTFGGPKSFFSAILSQSHIRTPGSTKAYKTFRGPKSSSSHAHIGTNTSQPDLPTLIISYFIISYFTLNSPEVSFRITKLKWRPPNYCNWPEFSWPTTGQQHKPTTFNCRHFTAASFSYSRTTTADNQLPDWNSERRQRIHGRKQPHLPLYFDKRQHWQGRTFVPTYTGTVEWKHNTTATYSTYKDYKHHTCTWMLTTSSLTQVQLHMFVLRPTQNSFLWNRLEYLHLNFSPLQTTQSKSMALDVFTTDVKDNQWFSPTLHVMWNILSSQFQDWLTEATTSTGQLLEPSYVDHLHRSQLKEMETFSNLPAEPQTLDEGCKIQTYIWTTSEISNRTTTAHQRGHHCTNISNIYRSKTYHGRKYNHVEHSSYPLMDQDIHQHLHLNHTVQHMLVTYRQMKYHRSRVDGLQQTCPQNSNTLGKVQPPLHSRRDLNLHLRML